MNRATRVVRERPGARSLLEYSARGISEVKVVYSKARNSLRGLVLAALVFSLLFVGPAFAQSLFPTDLPTRTEPSMGPLQSPTAMSGLRGQMLSLGAGMSSNDKAQDAATAMDLNVGTPLFWGWALGFGLQMRSIFDELALEDGDREFESANDRRWELGLGFAQRMGDTDLGFTWRRVNESEDADNTGGSEHKEDRGTFDLGIGQGIGQSLRLYAAVRDLSRRDRETPAWDLGLGLRPGTSRVGLHALVGFHEGDQVEKVGGALRVGLLTGLDLDVGGEVVDPGGADTWLVSARLAISLDPAGRYEAGWSGATAAPAETWQMAVRTRWTADYKESLLPKPPVALVWNVASSLEEAPQPGFFGGRSPSFVEAISNAAQALAYDEVRVLVLKIPSSGLGWSQAADLRGLVKRFHDKNRVVVAVLRAPRGPAVYLASAADQVYVDREGGVAFTGLYRPLRFFGPALDSLGIQVQYVRHAEYKSFPERFDRSEPSEAGREQEERLLDAFQEEVFAAIEERLEGEANQAQGFVDNAPHTAQQAVDAGFADGAVDTLDLEDRLRDDLEMPGLQIYDLPALRSTTRTGWGLADQVALVVVQGDIIAGKSIRYPGLGVQSSGEQDIVRAIDEARDGPYRAIFVRLVTPGGDAMASNMIARALARAAKKKPVIVSMGNVAASGGFDIACADSLPVFATPLTITGSVGIFALKPVIGKLTDKLGLPVTELSRGKHAGLFSTHRPWTEEEQQVLSEKLERYYLRFVDRVATARGLPLDKAEPLCRGRVWAGVDAKKHGLIDGVGGVMEAFDRLRAEVGVGSLRHLRFVPLPSTRGMFNALESGASALQNREIAEIFERVSAWIGTRELIRLAMQPPATVMARLPAEVLDVED